MRDRSSDARKTNDHNDLKETLYTFLTSLCPSDGKMLSAHGDVSARHTDVLISRQS